MKFIQPLPDWTSPIDVPRELLQPCSVPLRFIRFRYLHHAAPSGYDRVCDYVDAPTIQVSRSLYWLGETVMRPWAIWQARKGGKFEYSRYDCVMERAVIRDFLKSRNTVYHFVYAEKNFHLLEKHAGKNGNMLVGTVHHPPEHTEWLFDNTAHFKAFDELIVMDSASVDFWRGVTGRDNVRWLPHGIDTTYFAPVERDANATKRHVVFAGTHERDFETLDYTVRRMANERSHIHFDLIGRHETVVKLADELPNATQHAGISDEAYLKVFQNADVVYLPLLKSTVCNAVLEGMACGLGVVTSEGGITSYLNDEMAKVEKVSDTDGSFRALCELLDQPPADLRATALKQVEKFSWQAAAKMHVELYEEVHAKRAGSNGTAK